MYYYVLFSVITYAMIVIRLAELKMDKMINSCFPGYFIFPDTIEQSHFPAN